MLSDNTLSGPTTTTRLRYRGGVSENKMAVTKELRENRGETQQWPCKVRHAHWEHSRGSIQVHMYNEDYLPGLDRSIRAPSHDADIVHGRSTR